MGINIKIIKYFSLRLGFGRLLMMKIYDCNRRFDGRLFNLRKQIWGVECNISPFVSSDLF